MSNLPIGIQTFRKLRESDYCYADKTPLIERLAREGQMYFLARPRRFGKSLLVTTLADAFAGHRELFTGLYLETHWDWECRHPVLRLDFGEGILSTTALLDATVALQLAECAQAYGVTLTQEPIHLRLHELIHALHARTGERAVVLVDEYDKPILDHLDRPEVALALREGLRNLYSVLKSQDAHLRFVLLTGVSKFSKASLFSGLNNLVDITLDARYATLCGYTQGELESAFVDHLADVDLAEVKQWYNGYNFLGESVYNPFDVLLYLDSREFRPWWFETGTPTFLIKLLQARRYHIPDLENLETGEELLGTFDVDRIEPEALLFQTGYLIPFPDRFYLFQIKNHTVRHTRESGYPVFQRLPGFPHSRE